VCSLPIASLIGSLASSPAASPTLRYACGCCSSGPLNAGRNDAIAATNISFRRFQSLQRQRPFSRIKLFASIAAQFQVQHLRPTRSHTKHQHTTTNTPAWCSCSYHSDVATPRRQPCTCHAQTLCQHARQRDAQHHNTSPESAVTFGCDTTSTLS
jgi:hypothetical protein